jgi:DNA-binding MarR family transcriptional regulator/GNAT superfamily N-acetyltransferase
MVVTVPPTAIDDRVAAIRAFNRFYTQSIGLVRGSYLQSPYSLTEVRVLFELAQRDGTEVAALRRDLGIDAGYLSRVLTRLEQDGALARERSPADGRRQLVRLTDRGRAAFGDLDRRSAAEVGHLVAGLDEPDQRRLVGAMDTIQRLLQPAARPGAYLLRPLAPGDVGWIVYRHGVRYRQEYGWDASFEALVARIMADYAERHDPAREAGWIAEVDGEPVGCVLCVRRDETTAQLRVLLVEPAARGLGIGRRLVEECLRFARQAGYREIVLWTYDVLGAARRIYQAAGFELAEQHPEHSYGHDLTGQLWRRPL